MRIISWLLLFSIFIYGQGARSSSRQRCLSENCEERAKVKDQAVAAGSVGHHGGDNVSQSPPPSLMMLHQGVSDMMLQNSRLAARAAGYDIAYPVGGVCLGILLAATLYCLCQGGPSTHRRASLSFLEERDDDSDASVETSGEALVRGEWSNKFELSSLITSNSEVPEISLIAAPWDSTALDNIFKQYGLEKSWREARVSKLAEELREELSQECGLVNSWREGKTSKLADELIKELSQGKSSFFTQSGQTGLKCVIYVMQVALYYAPDNLVLQEFASSSDKAVFVTDDDRLPKTKMRIGEGIDECLFRCFTVKLGVSQAMAEKLARGAVLLRADEEATMGSAAAIIPNMSTVVRKLTIIIQVEDVEDNRKNLGIDEGSLSVDARAMQFRWERVAEDYCLGSLLKKAPDARKVKPSWKPSGLAVLPWSMSKVNEKLTSWGIAPTSFGADLRHLVKMLRHGEVQLGVEVSTGELVCVEHRVYLKLSNRNGDLLVHRGSGRTPVRLPNVHMFANETPFAAALRAARSLGSVSMRVELKPSVRDVQSRTTLEPPKLFAKGRPVKFVVRELMVEGLASTENSIWNALHTHLTHFRA